MRERFLRYAAGAATLLGAMLTGWAREGGQGAGPPVTSGVPGEADLPSVIMVPRSYRHDDRLAGGCWARFHEGKAYGGRSVTLVGPLQMPKMHIPGGLWVDWGSVIVGPAATVTTYDFEQFQNATAVLRPGQRVPDLRNRELGLFEDIHSLQIACERG